MKRLLRMLALCLALAAALPGCCEGNLEAADAVELFAVNVGKGDALILRAGGWTGLIDTGKASALGRVVSALKRMGVGRLDAVFITHTDDDHAGGLEWLAPLDALPVGAWYAPALYTGVKPEKHPMLKAAQERGEEVAWLRRGDVIPLGGAGAELRVLAPASLFTDKDDNNSLVMMLESAQGRILLAGDMELPEEAELLSQGDDLGCAVLKVANHGDDDTTSAEFARACSAALAVISTDSLEKPGTPDPGVVARLEQAGSRVVVTQDAPLGLLVTLSGGEAALEYAQIDANPVEGLALSEVDAGDDTVTLINRGGEAVNLELFYLYSERGGEIFVFPGGASIVPGGALKVGTNSTEGAYDLLWDDKKVIHKKKSDTVLLYDRFGRLVDSLDNGL